MSAAARSWIILVSHNQDHLNLSGTFASANDLARSLRTLLAFISSRLSALEKKQVFSAYTASVAGDRFTVAHSLGVVPTSVTALPTADCRVWATDDDRKLWTTSQVVLRGSAVSTRVHGHVEFIEE
jgi:hypothetical protein